MKISVLICTWNRGALIDGTLKSLLKDSSVLPDEVIVVNGGGENNAAEILDLWAQQYNLLKIINTNNVNLATSRNIGISLSTGDLLLMTDDDALVFPDWIEKMILLHNLYPSAGVIGGEVIDISTNSGFWNLIADITTFPRYSETMKVRHVPGVNCGFKREAINSVGLQDTELKRGEDVDYTWRCLNNGYDVIYSPEVKVYHSHRASFKGLVKQHMDYGRSYVRVRRKWPNMYCAYPRQINNTKSVLKLIYFLFFSSFVYAYKQIAIKSFKYNKICVFLGISFIAYCFKAGIAEALMTSSDE